MGLFSPADLDKINQAAQKSKVVAESAPKKKKSMGGITSELERISATVREYFKDSDAILISDEQTLHDYVSEVIKVGYAGIDTETTGLDRVNDTIVGASLYHPNGREAYFPMRHISPIFGTPYKGQLTYEQVGKEFQRLVDAKVKLIFANADFDLGMIYKDLKVDMIPSVFYDVITAWRCVKEDEKDNALKVLYAKYPMHGNVDPMKFRDFFPPDMFPYCKPEVAALYAAHDAKITYELFLWQLPYLQKDNPKCQKKHLEAVSDLVFGLEFPIIEVCQNLHRRGMYLEQTAAEMLQKKYYPEQEAADEKLRQMVQQVLDDPQYSTKVRCPFRSASEFLPNSDQHVAWLCYDLMGLGDGKDRSTKKEILKTFNMKITDQILECRSLRTLISTFIEKLPKSVASDSRIHCTFNAIGADTGRMSSKSPNMQNVPSRHGDIRRMFRATPGYVLLSSDYS